jgi:DnaJ-class molecular chaperone
MMDEQTLDYRMNRFEVATEDELWASLCSPEPYDRPAKPLKECGMCEGRGWIDDYDGPRYNSEAGICAHCGGRGKK